jgi:chromosomal replication initiator protein
MVTESVSESIYRPNYFPLPPSPISTERDEVLDNLVGVLNTTLTHPDEAVQLVARKALDEVRRVQEQARRKLADQQAGLSARRLELLIYEIACVLQIDADKLKSRRRTQHVAFQRQIAMYLLRRVSGASFPTIGEHFRRNHSTVIYAVALIERRIKRDAVFRQLEGLEAQITRPTTTTDRFDRRTAGAESDGHGARDGNYQLSPPPPPA